MIRPLRTTLLLLGLVGCAHRGLNMPGPTDRMGHTPEAPGPKVAQKAPAKQSGKGSVAPRRIPKGGGEKVAICAGDLVGVRPMVVNGETYRYDCSGFVMAAYAGAGHGVRGSTKDMYERAEELGLLHHRRVGQPGEVVFFDDTHDRNGNRKRDDELTHIAIVERVLPDGTMTLVHLGSDGVVRIAMNLKRPHDRKDENGDTINSVLRVARDHNDQGVLTSELFRAFGTLYLQGGGMAWVDRSNDPDYDPALDPNLSANEKGELEPLYIPEEG
jgi:hypothetical protein